jgi:hypothetical protein
LRRRSRRPRPNYGPIRRGTNTGATAPVPRAGASSRPPLALAVAGHPVPTEAIGNALADAYNALEDEELSLFPGPPRSHHPPPVGIAAVAELLGVPAGRLHCLVHGGHCRQVPDRPRSPPHLPSGIASGRWWRSTHRPRKAQRRFRAGRRYEAAQGPPLWRRTSLLSVVGVAPGRRVNCGTESNGGQPILPEFTGRSDVAKRLVTATPPSYQPTFDPNAGRGKRATGKAPSTSAMAPVG